MLLHQNFERKKIYDDRKGCWCFADCGGFFGSGVCVLESKFVEKNGDENGKWGTVPVWIFRAPMRKAEQFQRKFEAATPTIV